MSNKHSMNWATFGILLLWTAFVIAQTRDQTEEFCLQGEFDLGSRLQGFKPEAGEFYATSWCVISDSESQRVRFHAMGKSNPDIDGEFVVAFLTPATVRISSLNGDADLEFSPVDITAEAARYRRLNPLHLLQDFQAHPEWQLLPASEDWLRVQYPGEVEEVQLRIDADRLSGLRTMAELPLRGRVQVQWNWDWSVSPVTATLQLDGMEVFRGVASWRTLDPQQASEVWQPTGNLAPRVIPGNNWPARVGMQLEKIGDGIYLVNSVRTGFNHLVVETDAGLIVGDAPAGWVELTQIPPSDLVPGLGISGLSEQFIDFLQREFPGKPIRAVALTHAHDDHAGGARAFAAAGATIYAPAATAEFLEHSLNRTQMPTDRLSQLGSDLQVVGIDHRMHIDDARNPVTLLSVNSSPHTEHALGILVGAGEYFFQSDMHVPSSDADSPAAFRAATECWFARWAVTNLPAETIVLSSHSSVHTPVSRLQKYLASSQCN